MKQTTDTQRENVVELYRFARGSQTWNYTSSSEQQSDQGVTYYPAQISRSKITKTVEQSSNQVTITCPRTMEYANQFIFMQANGATAVTIYELDTKTGFKRVLWQGRAVNVNFGVLDCKIRCETLLTALSNQLESPTFQEVCPWNFCDPHSCRISRATLEEKVIVTAQQGNSVTVEGVRGSFTYTGGIVTVSQNGEPVDYFISEAGPHGASTQTLRLDIVPPEIVGRQVSVYIGCDHTLGYCRSLGNHLNYGGHPWVPELCPMDGSLIF